MTKPTKEQFEAYLEVQESGVTNMFHMTAVIDYARELCSVELTTDNCLYIMKHYNDLKEEFRI